MTENMSKFREALVEKKEFTVTWEVVPGRGSFETAQHHVITSAEQAVQDQKIHALAITDNPGGNPATSAEMLGAEVRRIGIEPLVHFTCKDKNRNQLESLLYGLERALVHNVLVLTGDYSSAGFQGASSPVFDIDATQLLRLVAELNGGMEIPTLRRTVKLAPTHFFAGAVVSQFKILESELMGQYYKLQKKLEAGAQFVVSQVGYDARKMHELILMMKLLGYDQVPLIGNIYVLSRPAARAMNRNRVPGCVVTGGLMSAINTEAKASDRGKAKSLERGAKMYAILKGMGYEGVHIGGHGLKYEELGAILDMGEELAPNWLDLLPEFDFPQPDGWYYFERDPETGLNKDVPVDRSGDRPPSPVGYRIFRTMHGAMFDPEGSLFKPMRSLCAKVDGSVFEDTFDRLEHVAKVITNDCMHCGDCGLSDVAYICPTSQCPKHQRNGPCGGSHEGWCEVYPEKRQCIYVRAYPRLKHYDEEDSLSAYQVPPIDHDLSRTSSWLNYFLGRDHTAKRLGIKPLEKQKAKE